MSTYNCDVCQYNTPDASNFAKHLKSKKHSTNKEKILDSTDQQKSANFTSLTKMRRNDLKALHSGNVVIVPIVTLCEEKSPLDGEVHINWTYNPYNQVPFNWRNLFDREKTMEDAIRLFCQYHRLNQPGYNFPLRRATTEQVNPDFESIVGSNAFLARIFSGSESRYQFLQPNEAGDLVWVDFVHPNPKNQAPNDIVRYICSFLANVISAQCSRPYKEFFENSTEIGRLDEHEFTEEHKADILEQHFDNNFQIGRAHV